MATSEEIRLAHELVIELERIREQIRDNAEAYKIAINAGTPPAQVVAVMKANADQFQSRLERVRRAIDVAGVRAKLLSGLAVLGVDPVVARADYVTMNNICQQVWDATLATNAQVLNASNQILSALPAHDSVIGGPLPVIVRT